MKDLHSLQSVVSWRVVCYGAPKGGYQMRTFFFAVALVVSTLTGNPATATVYDVTTDWSDALNPNGVWTYAANGSALSSTVRASDPWGVPQASWGDLPGWFRSNGTEAFPHNWLAGDIITHTGV